MNEETEKREIATRSIKVRQRNFIKLWKLKLHMDVPGLDDVVTTLLELYERENGPVKVE